MANNVLESYLVSLGFSVSQPELRKFQDGLKAAANAVTSNTSGMIGNIAKWQTAIVSGFAAVAGAAIGLADHVAEQDQKFRLLGLRFFMTTESAKKMQIGLEALGASMEEVAWDPELHARFLTLVDDQKKLEDQLGTDFSQQMKSIRDLRFEFTRLQVAGQYLGMKVVSDIFKSFGLTIEDVMLKLRGLSSWVQDHLPDISSAITSTLLPVLNDAWVVLKHTGVALKDAAIAFINLTGALTGDPSIEDTTFKFENLSKAIKDLSGVFRDFAEYFNDALQEMSHLVNALSFALTGKFTAAVEELKAFKDIESRGAPKTLDLFHMGTPNPAYKRETGPLGMPNGPLAPVVVEAAKRVGVDPRIALGVATQESGVRQNRPDGSPITSSAGALGVMQLMPGTAKGLGVNPLDANENIRGGVQYLAQLYAKYKDWRLSLAAYNAGPGAVDKALRSPNGLASLPAETQDYITKVMGIASRANVGGGQETAPDKPSIFGSNSGMDDDYARRASAESHGESKNNASMGEVAQNVTVGDVSIQIMQPNASPEQIRASTHEGIIGALRKQTQRDLAQLSPVY